MKFEKFTLARVCVRMCIAECEGVLKFVQRLSAAQRADPIFFFKI